MAARVQEPELLVRNTFLTVVNARAEEPGARQRSHSDSSHSRTSTEERKFWLPSSSLSSTTVSSVGSDVSRRSGTSAGREPQQLREEASEDFLGSLLADEHEDAPQPQQELSSQATRSSKAAWADPPRRRVRMIKHNLDTSLPRWSKWLREEASEDCLGSLLTDEHEDAPQPQQELSSQATRSS